MSNPPISHIYAPFTFVPTGPMVPRRYRPLSRVRSYFEDGLFSYNLAEFSDEEEGKLIYYGPQEAPESSNAESDGIRIAPGAIPGRQNAIRQKYFACCMRAGTDEDRQIWKTYIGDDEMRAGVAMEMTFDGLCQQLPTDGSNRYVGMCWYIDRMKNEQPWQFAATNCFLKGQKHHVQREFRVLSRYDASDLTYPDDWTWPESDAKKPDYGDNPWVKLDIDTRSLTDRIVLAPNADQSVRDEINSILSDNLLDIPVVESQLAGGPSISQAHNSETIARGQRLYEKGGISAPDSKEYHQEIVNQWVAETDFEQQILDVVEREWCGLAILEGHRYNTADPNVEPDDYLFGNIPYATIIQRCTAPDHSIVHADERGNELLNAQQADSDE